MNAIRAQELAPWATGWEPMPDKKPRVRKCPACKSTPLWRHMLRCYWIVCTTCGLSTAAFKTMEGAAGAWNIGSEETDRVQGELEITEATMDEIIDQVTGRSDEEG